MSLTLGTHLGPYEILGPLESDSEAPEELRAKVKS